MWWFYPFSCVFNCSELAIMNQVGKRIFNLENGRLNCEKPFINFTISVANFDKVAKFQPGKSILLNETKTDGWLFR